MTKKHKVPTIRRHGNSQKISKLVNYFWENPEAVLTIEQMMQIAGMPRRTFFYNFRKFTGHAPQNYFKLVRLHFAHRDLSRGDGNVTQLALQYNFYHLGEFSALYRKVYGVLPSVMAGRSQSTLYSMAS